MLSGARVPAASQRNATQRNAKLYAAVLHKEVVGIDRRPVSQAPLSAGLAQWRFVVRPSGGPQAALKEHSSRRWM